MIKLVVSNRERVVAAIKTIPEWFTVKEMCEMTCIAKNTIRETLARLANDGQLERAPRYSTAVAVKYRATDRLGQTIAKRMEETRSDVVVMAGPANIFRAIIEVGHDEDFIPRGDYRFIATGAAPGSQEKIEILKRRVELGYPLWHKHDRNNYNGMTGAIIP